MCQNGVGCLVAIALIQSDLMMEFHSFEFIYRATCHTAKRKQQKKKRTKTHIRPYNILTSSLSWRRVAVASIKQMCTYADVTNHCHCASQLCHRIYILQFCHFHIIYFQGEDSVEYFLGLTPSGIVVLRNKSTVAYYYWPRIAKVYFKGRYFMLRVCDKNVSPFTLCFSHFALWFLFFLVERIKYNMWKLRWWSTSSAHCSLNWECSLLMLFHSALHYRFLFYFVFIVGFVVFDFHVWSSNFSSTAKRKQRIYEIPCFQRGKIRRIKNEYIKWYASFSHTERPEHLRFRNAPKNGMQTFVEVLCWASRLLPIGSCLAGAASRQSWRLVCPRVTLSVQVISLYNFQPNFELNFRVEYEFIMQRE